MIYEIYDAMTLYCIHWGYYSIADVMCCVMCDVMVSSDAIRGYTVPYRTEDRIQKLQNYKITKLQITNYKLQK